MAFEIDYTDKHLARHPKCYCRILTAIIDYGLKGTDENSFLATVLVGFYHDEASRRSGLAPFMTATFQDYELSKKEISQYANVRNLGYTHLKDNVSLFTGAKNV
jgi:hypothetical protein